MSLVQYNSAAPNTSAALSSAVTLGHTIYAIIQAFNDSTGGGTSTSGTLTDSVGNSYSFVGSVPGGTTGPAIYLFQSTATHTTAPSMGYSNWSGAPPSAYDCIFTLVEVTQATTLDVVGTQYASTSSSSSVSASVTTTTAHDALIAVIALYNSGGAYGPDSNKGIQDPPTGWTTLGAQQNLLAQQIAGEACYQEVTSTGTYSATWSISVPTDVTSVTAVVFALSFPQPVAFHGNGITQSVGSLKTGAQLAGSGVIGAVGSGTFQPRIALAGGGTTQVVGSATRQQPVLAGAALTPTAGYATLTPGATIGVVFYGGGVVPTLGRATLLPGGTISMQGVAKTPTTGYATLTPGATISMYGSGATTVVGSGSIAPAIHASAAQTQLNFEQAAIFQGGSSVPTDLYFGDVVALIPGHDDSWGSGALHIHAYADFSPQNNWVQPFTPPGAGGPRTTNSAPSGVVNSIDIPNANFGFTIRDPANFNFGTGDFTIEGWFYSNEVNGAMLQFLDDTGANKGPAISGLTTYIGYVYDSAGGAHAVTPTATITGYTWTHFAFVRYGGTNNFFLNGTPAYPTWNADATACGNATTLQVGGTGWDGHITELRITKGLARYTAGFTTPSAPLPRQAAISYATRHMVGAQTIPSFGQAYYVFENHRSVAGAQTIPSCTQVATVAHGNNRIVNGAQTIPNFAQTYAAYSAPVLHVSQANDPYFGYVAYLLHGQSQTVVGSDDIQLDSSSNDLTVNGISVSIVTDGAAVGGHTIGFGQVDGSCLTQWSYVTNGSRTIHTTEMRVRFDTLNYSVPTTYVGPGDYTFDPSQQQTGWFFASNNITLGLAGQNGALPADWISYGALGSGAAIIGPYVLQLKGYQFLGGYSYLFDIHGTTSITTGWHSIAIVRNGATINVYLDGNLEMTGTLVAFNALFMDETFVTGWDTTDGFAYSGDHQNLSAIEEMRHTWGVARYTANYTPATTAFPNVAAGQMPNATQVATATHYSGHLVHGAQFLSFTQVATAFHGTVTLHAAAAQTVPGFTDVYQTSGQKIRHLGATQQMDLGTQVATVAPPREINNFFVVETLPAFAQTATIGTTEHAAAVQSFSLTQVATARHAAHTESANQVMAGFAQAATAKVIGKLTGAESFSFAQAAVAKVIHKAQAAQLIGPMLDGGSIQGGFITSSTRGFRIDAEQRTQTVN